MKKWIIISVLALSVVFCSVGAPTSPTVDVDAIVNGTLSAVAAATTATAQALTAAAPPATETPAFDVPTSTPEASGMGVVSGKLSYPSERIPPLRIVAFEVKTGEYLYIDTQENQSTYTFELPAGIYNIVAYLRDGSYAGGYSQAVPCGLAAECADHSLIDVSVTPGAAIPDIDPADWYAQPGDFPPMPES